MRQRSPFLTQPPGMVRRVRSLRRVITTSPTDARHAVSQTDLATVVGAVEEEPLGAGPLVEGTYGVGGLGDEDARHACVLSARHAS